MSDFDSSELIALEIVVCWFGRVTSESARLVIMLNQKIFQDNFEIARTQLRSFVAIERARSKLPTHRGVLNYIIENIDSIRQQDLLSRQGYSANNLRNIERSNRHHHIVLAGRDLRHVGAVTLYPVNYVRKEAEGESTT